MRTYLLAGSLAVAAFFVHLCPLCFPALHVFAAGFASVVAAGLESVALVVSAANAGIAIMAAVMANVDNVDNFMAFLSRY
jgi:hypothetical protein